MASCSACCRAFRCAAVAARSPPFYPKNYGVSLRLVSTRCGRWSSSILYPFCRWVAAREGAQSRLVAELRLVFERGRVTPANSVSTEPISRIPASRNSPLSKLPEASFR